MYNEARRVPGTVQGVALILPVVLSVMGAVLLAPVVPQLMRQFADVPNAQYWVPTLLSVPALCIALFSPLVGWVSDRVGRRQLLIIAMVLYAGFGMAPLVLDDFFVIYGTRVGVGICEAVVMVVSTTLIGDYFDAEERDKWLGSQAALASLTAMVLFPVAGALGLISWRGPFALYGISLILVIGVVLFTWEPQRDRSKTGNQSAKGERTPFPWRRMLGICCVTLLTAIMFYILQFQMSSALQTFDIDSTLMTGVFLATASLGVPAGAIFYRFAHRRVSLTTLLMGEFLLLAIGFMGMSHAPNAVVFTAIGFVNQFGAGMLLPTLLTWGIAGLTFENRGRGTGMWQSTFAFGQFASTVVFAYAMAMVGGVMPALLLFGVLALLMACSAAFMLWRGHGSVLHRRAACNG